MDAHRRRQSLLTTLATTVATLGLVSSAHSAPVLVLGPAPAPPFAGTLIDFEGFTEGTLIDTQYSAQGVTFVQPDTGRPQIDNHPGEFGYGPSSGIGMLTGSTEVERPFPPSPAWSRPSATRRTASARSCRIPPSSAV